MAGRRETRTSVKTACVSCHIENMKLRIHISGKMKNEVSIIYNDAVAESQNS